MVTAFFLTGASAACLAALYWGLTGRHQRPDGAAQLSGVMAAFAAAFLAFTPQVQKWENSLRPDLALLTSNVTVLAVAVSLRLLLLRLNRPPAQARRRIRIHLATAVAVTTTVIVLYLATSARSRGPAAPVLDYMHPTLGLFTLLCTFYLAVATAEFLRQTWRRARSSRSRYLRLGLLTAAAGLAISLLYSAFKITMVLSVRFCWDLVPAPVTTCASVSSPTSCLFTITVPGTATLLVVLGLTVPAATWPLHQMRWRIWEKVCFAELEPLWSELISLNPQVALPGTTGHDSPDYLLHRRVIEISDGILALRPYHSRAVQKAAEQALRAAGKRLDSPNSEAIVEAAILAAAVQAKRSDWQPTPRQAHREHEPKPFTDLRDETRRLRRLARAYAHYEASPALQQVGPAAARPEAA
ncbi:MAB_1171c family putative transporter [Streptomyces sp. NPDC002446]